MAVVSLCCVRAPIPNVSGGLDDRADVRDPAVDVHDELAPLTPVVELGPHVGNGGDVRQDAGTDDGRANLCVDLIVLLVRRLSVLFGQLSEVLLESVFGAVVQCAEDDVELVDGGSAGLASDVLVHGHEVMHRLMAVRREFVSVLLEFRGFEVLPVDCLQQTVCGRCRCGCCHLVALLRLCFLEHSRSLY